MMIGILGGALIGTAVAFLVSVLMPTKPKLAAALESIEADPVVGTSISDSRQEKVGRWAMTNVPSIFGAAANKSDLALVGISEVDHYYNKVKLALFGLPLVALIGLNAQLLGFPITVPFLAVVPVMFLLWRYPDSALKRQAAKARNDFSRGVGSYIELVAAEIRRSAPVTVALSEAATVADSWIFRRIAEELNRARYRNVQAWDALLLLSDELEIPELAEAARIAQLSGKDGGKIYSSLRSLGRTLRLRNLTEEHAKANVVSGKISHNVTFIVMVFIVMIVIPMLLTISQ